MATTVAEIIVERLKDAGVARVYGIPGDSLNGFTDPAVPKRAPPARRPPRRPSPARWRYVREVAVPAICI